MVECVSEYIFLIKKNQERNYRKQKKIKKKRGISVEYLTAYDISSFDNLLCIILTYSIKS